MRSNQKTSIRTKSVISSKTANPSTVTAIAISKKLLEIKRIFGSVVITELNMALFRHLK